MFCQNGQLAKVSNHVTSGDSSAAVIGDFNELPVYTPVHDELAVFLTENQVRRKKISRRLGGCRDYQCFLIIVCTGVYMLPVFCEGSRLVRISNY